MTIFHCNIRNRQYTHLVASERHLYTLNKTLDARIDECCIDTPLRYSYDSSKFQERAQCISTGGTLSETILHKDTTHWRAHRKQDHTKLYNIN